MKNKFVNIILKFIVILVIVLIGIFSVYMYTNAKEETSKTDKVEQELGYLDSKIINILNGLNNIKLQNYKVTVTKTEESKSQTMGGTSEGKSNSEGTEEKKDEEQGKEETKITKMEQEVVGGDDRRHRLEFNKK